MAIIKLGIEGDSSSVNELISILEIDGCDGNMIYELHNQTTTRNEEPHFEFIKRSKDFYKTFVNPNLVDQWASNDISYVAKIKDVWYVVSNSGSNTYLGTGPTSTLRIREFCSNKNIRILYVESPLEKWLKQTTNTDQLFVNSKKKEKRTESQSYSNANLIISRCGEGISRIIQTATKLNENQCRDLFLAAVNSHTNFVIDAESKNKDGFIDLKFTDTELLASFIYEFKIHCESKDIKRGLDQITDQYATVCNKFNGLVFINKEQKNLGEIKENILNELENYRSCLSIIDIKSELNENKIVVKHKHTNDFNTICLLTIFIIDIQPTKVKVPNRP